MRKNLKFFLIAFLISLPFWWGANLLKKNLEDSFYRWEITKNPQILAAQLNQKILEAKLESLKPVRDRRIEDLKIEARSAISVLFNQEEEKVLFEKESNKKLPIASLTKLMTANIVLENYDLAQEIEISKEAILEERRLTNLKVGEKFLAKDLLYALLMESSNAAAQAFTDEITGPKGFIELMSLETKNLGLLNTYFLNPTGLDPESPAELANYSTAGDLAKFSQYLLKKPLIWKILSTSEFNLYSSDGVLHYQLSNTNEFFDNKIPGRQVQWGSQIVGGKTGWTLRAGGCLLLVLKAPNSKGYLINIILGSDNRFGEMEKLVNWLLEAYKW